MLRYAESKSRRLRTLARHASDSVASFPWPCAEFLLNSPMVPPQSRHRQAKGPVAESPEENECDRRFSRPSDFVQAERERSAENAHIDPAEVVEPLFTLGHDGNGKL